MPRGNAAPGPRKRGGADSGRAVSAVVLAGGRATRMDGADKGLVAFRGRPLVARICEALRPQVAEVMINANRNRERYRQFGHRVIKDRLPGHQGPLAGMHAALLAARHPWLLTIPCDGPFVAADYAARMRAAATAADVLLAVAHDGVRTQPVYSLIHRSLADSLERFLRGGERKIDLWHEQHAFATVDFSADRHLFTNINTPQQLAGLQAGRPGAAR